MDTTPSDGVIQGTMTAKIAQVAAGAPTKVKADEAYRELQQWTLSRLDAGDDKDAARAKQRIATKYEAHKQAAQKKGEPVKDAARFLRDAFFREYWMLHCDAFADALMKRINGPQYPTLMALRRKTTSAVDQAAADGKSGPAVVAGRDTSVRGMTMVALGKSLTETKAEAGIAVHVKLRPEVDRPYDPNVKDEMHHWFVHVGQGLFSDSFGANQTGAKADAFLRGWVDAKFHQRGRRGDKFDYRTFHTADYCEPESLARFEALEREGKDTQAAQKKLPKAKPGFASKVSAIYRPMHAKTTGAADKKG